MGSIGDWLDIAYKVITGIFAVWFYFDRKNDKTNQRISSLEIKIDQRMDGVCERITRVESDLENAPSHNDLGKIYDEIRNQSREVSNVAKIVERLAGAFEQQMLWLRKDK